DAVASQPEALRALGVGHGRYAKLLVTFIAGEVDPSRLGQIGVSGRGAAGRRAGGSGDGHAADRGAGCDRAEHGQRNERLPPRPPACRPVHRSSSPGVPWCLDWESTVFGVVCWGWSPVRVRIGRFLTQTPNVQRGSRRLVTSSYRRAWFRHATGPATIRP